MARSKKTNNDITLSHSESNALHFLFRVSSTYMGYKTYEEHKKLEDRHGYVWWGKFGLGVAKWVVEQVKKQVEANVPTYVYFLVGRNICYRSQVSNIVGGGGSTKYESPEPMTVPMYYREQKCSVWFKLRDLKPISNVIDFVLYNDPYLEPKLTSMRALIYVRHGTATSTREDTVEHSLNQLRYPTRNISRDSDPFADDLLDFEEDNNLDDLEPYDVVLED